MSYAGYFLETKEEVRMTTKFNPKTGRWEAFHSARHPITRQPISLRRQANTESEAKKIERELIQRVTARLIEEASPSWKKCVAEYLEDCRDRGLTEHTRHDCKTALEAHTFAPWGNKRIKDITQQNVRDVMAGPIRNKSRSHQKNVFKFIRQVLNFAVSRGYIQRNPCPDLRFKIGDKIRKVLTEPEVRTLLNTAKQMNVEWYPHWSLAVYSGLRNGELYALPWVNVNLENRTMLVNQSWNNKDGFKCTKSGDDRIVEIAPPLLEVLRELKLRSGGSPFVLPRIDKWDKGEQARELRMFLLGLGLPAVRFHDLRATWATLLLSKGVEPIKVMKAGGWKDMKTMMHYVRKAGVDIRGMSDCLDLHDPRAENRILSFSAQKDGRK